MLLPKRPRSSSPAVLELGSEKVHNLSSPIVSPTTSFSSVLTHGQQGSEKIHEGGNEEETFSPLPSGPKVLLLRRFIAPGHMNSSMAHSDHPDSPASSEASPRTQDSVSLSTSTPSRPPRRIQRDGPPKPEDFEWALDHEMNLEDEEPFSLDTYLRLLRTHLLLGKDLIIARVQTQQSPPQASGYSSRPTFYSYYAAHPLNKLLFRTQIERGLIHRVQARNPLNNMYIRGPVEYYTILASESRKLEDGGERPVEQGRATSCSPSLSPTKTSGDMWSSPIPTRPSSAQGCMEVRRRTEEEEKEEEIRKEEEDKRGEEENRDTNTAWWASAPSASSSSSSKSLVYRAYYIGNDTDFLQHPQMRIYFWHHAIKPDDARLFPLYSEGEMNRMRFPRMPRRPLLFFPSRGLTTHPSLPVGSEEESQVMLQQRALWEADERRRLSRQAGRNCVRWLILSYILTVFVLLLFYMPTHLAGGAGIIVGSLFFILLASYLSFARSPLGFLRRRCRRRDQDGEETSA